MDNPEDILYLKKFVTEHPDNKMGWYLLGKYYREEGKEAKANYCFIQAGDIYDAFEQEAHPLAEAGLDGLKEWEKQKNKRKLLRKVTLLAAPLLVLALALPVSSFFNHKIGTAVTSLEQEPGFGVVLVPEGEEQPIGYALGKVAAAGDAGPGQVIAARLEERDGWSQWSGQSILLADIARRGGGSELAASMLDRDTCWCEPADAEGARRQWREWQSRQEMHWTLASAIHHYKAINGRWPQKLDELIQPYPNNILAGEGDGMREAFPAVLMKLREQNGTGAERPTADKSGAGKESGRGQSELVGSNGLLDEAWSKPLEIVVDPSKHQLAVVQGNTIIRSYPVGLGGDRTPEGEFRISEKVRNPNGRDDGVFGSRGMTLSDTLYAIHGTDDPGSIGGDESLGCVRMGKSDVEELYDMVPLGTKVSIKKGSLPTSPAPAPERFRMKPKEDESNPHKVYEWLT